MPALVRYLAREIYTATAFVLFSLLAIFAFFEIVRQFDEIGRGGRSVSVVLAFIALSQPVRIYELMPLAALIGTIYTLAKLASTSEFTIMRVSGMSTRRLAGWVAAIGAVFVVATYALGELVAPPAERLARTVQAEASGANIARELRSGVWSRDLVKDANGDVTGLRFINVGQVRPDSTTSQWRVFEFDRDFRLRSISTADEGVYLGSSGERAWRLTNFVETKVPAIGTADTLPTPARTEVIREPEHVWHTDLSPELFGVLLVLPERMAIVELGRYIRHLTENRQRADRYEFAYWNKLFYPLSILVMMALALPFAYLHVREGGVSLKIFAGIMIGVVAYMMNKLVVHIGTLNTWPPILVAALPSAVIMAAALAALYWIERR